MGRIWTTLGILCIIGSIVFMLSTVFIPENPIMYTALQTIACTDNETLRTEQRAWSLPNGERGINITYFCDIEPNQGRNVTDLSVLVQVIGFTGLLGSGIMMIIIGLTRTTQNKVGEWQQSLQQQLADQRDGTYVSVQGNMQNIPPETRDMIESMLGGVMQNATMNKSVSLSERLEQLEEAYHKNLISKEEYDRVRHAILDSMDD